MNSASNTCPLGTAWCTQHESFVNQWSEETERCLAWLHVTSAAFAHIAPSEAPPAATLTLSAGGNESAHLHCPSLGLSVFGSIPWGVQPEQARALAEALLKGAEIVDGSRSGTCEECGDHVFPEQLEDDGTCYGCQNRRRMALRSLMRGKNQADDQ